MEILLEAGAVHAEKEFIGRRGKTVYSLTNEGLHSLKNMFDCWRRYWKRKGQKNSGIMEKRRRLFDMKPSALIYRRLNRLFCRFGSVEFFFEVFFTNSCSDFNDFNGFVGNHVAVQFLYFFVKIGLYIGNAFGFQGFEIRVDFRYNDFF